MSALQVEISTLFFFQDCGLHSSKHKYQKNYTGAVRRAPFRVRRLSWRKAHDSIIVPYVSLLITKLQKFLKPFPLRVHHSWDSRFSRYVLAATLVDENKRPLIFILPFFFNCQAAFVHDIIVTCVSRYWLQPTHSAHLCPEICVSRCMHHPTNYEVSS